jgi:hypothetical protein
LAKPVTAKDAKDAKEEFGISYLAASFSQYRILKKPWFLPGEAKYQVPSTSLCVLRVLCGKSFFG